jgi:peptidoglycan LD-endopeptidase CwlK
MPVVSRSLSYLSADTRVKAQQFLRECSILGLDVLVTCTYRDNAAQAALYASGRTVAGPLLTNAKPGRSLHNCVEAGVLAWTLPVPASKAFDVVPMLAGKPQWGTTGDALKMWQKIGEVGEACGLQWAGRWTGRLREFPHFQNG